MSGAAHSFSFLGWNPAALWWLPLAALALDLAVGDPPKLPHPVRVIARLAQRLEKLLRPRLEALDAGAAATALVLAFSGGAAYLALLLPKAAALTAWLYLSFTGLALGQLLREGKKALRLLRAAEQEADAALRDNREDFPALEAARAAIQQLVRRDVGNADSAFLSRTLAETLSENLNNAFVAPFFWLMVGGPVMLWLYKAASTLNSFWGYSHEPWARFGTAAAKINDLLAFAPARLTALALRLCAPFCGARGVWPGWFFVASQARATTSPNAGWPMAACAWLHAAPMCGSAVHAGAVERKPLLGPASGSWTTPALACLLRHIGAAGLLAALFLWLAGVAIALPWAG